MVKAQTAIYWGYAVENPACCTVMFPEREKIVRNDLREAEENHQSYLSLEPRTCPLQPQIQREYRLDYPARVAPTHLGMHRTRVAFSRIDSSEAASVA